GLGRTQRRYPRRNGGAHNRKLLPVVHQGPASAMTLQVTILGCGSSGGVPRIGGPDGAGLWGACDPSNPKNRRRRCSLLVQRKSNTGTTSLLVDTSPDMREQLISARVSALDAVFISHDHADQLHGIDDLRMIAMNMRRRVDVYADEGA